MVRLQPWWCQQGSMGSHAGQRQHALRLTSYSQRVTRGLIHWCAGTHSPRHLTPTPAFRDDQDGDTTPWCGCSRGGASREVWDRRVGKLFMKILILVSVTMSKLVVVNACATSQCSKYLPLLYLAPDPEPRLSRHHMDTNKLFVRSPLCCGSADLTISN